MAGGRNNMGVKHLGIKNRNVAANAGIRPFKMDLTYASSTAFLAARLAAGGSGTAAEGDYFYNTTNNRIESYNGTSWVDSVSGATLTTGSIFIGAAGLAAELDVKGDGKILVGNGTTATSVAVSGDVALTSAGAATVTDLTIASEARGDILRRGASTWERHVAKTSGQILVGDGTDIVSVAVSGDVTLAANGAVAIAASVVHGGDVALVTDAASTGGIPVLHRIAVAGGAAGNTDVVLTEKTRVIDVWAVHTGGAGEASDTIQVLNTASAITNAMDWSGADEAVVRAGTINDANHEIPAAGTLRITTVDADAGSDVGAGIVYVLGVKVS